MGAPGDRGVPAGTKVMPGAVLERALYFNKYIPHMPTERQMAFLQLECLDALVGGAGGGGKSEALLMAALMFVNVPGYAALIVRRNLTDLKLPGGLLDRSADWLKGKAEYNAQEHRWRFKEGSTLQFGFADKEGDELRYHSAEFQGIFLDEAVQFTEKQIKFFFERLRRRVDIPVPLRVRLATTPGGVSHEFLKKRYIDPGTPGKVFVPARLRDNEHVDQGQYVESLAEVDPLRRAQVLDGDWNAVEGGRFKGEWFGRWRVEAVLPDTVVLDDGAGREVERFRFEGCGCFQTVDPAASTSAAADYFVDSTWIVSPRANVVWWGCHRDKHEIPEQVAHVKRLYRRHRPQFVAVEEVLNQRALAQLLRRSTDPAMVVKGAHPRGQDKLARSAGFVALASSGRVFVPEPPRRGLLQPSAAEFPVADVLDEVVRFTGVKGQDAHDDICLIGATEVETEYGPRPIERIMRGDRVWTRSGLRTVLGAGITSARAPLVTVEFDTGRKLTGTPAHRVFVWGTGFVRLDTLCCGDKVVAWGKNHEPSASNSQDAATFATPTRSGGSTGSTSSATTRSVVRRATFIATSGSFTTDRSPTGAKYITGTGTRSTTLPIISPASPGRSTGASTPPAGRTGLPRSWRIWSAFVLLLQGGTGAQRGARGTPKTHVVRWQNAPPSSASANTATRATGPRPDAPGTVPRGVRTRRDTTPGSMMWTAPVSCAQPSSGPTRTRRPELVLARLRTVSAGGCAAVFNLTVEGAAEYFAAGVLVHNCDTGSLMAELLPLVRGYGPLGRRPPVKHASKDQPWTGLE